MGIYGYLIEYMTSKGERFMKKNIIGIGILWVCTFCALSPVFAGETTVVLGGELEFEFVDSENDPTVKKPDPYFKIDQLYLYPKVTFGENVILRADIAIKADTAIIEEVWGRFSGLPFNSWLEAGLNDMFIANIDRKLENEILIETAFYRDDDMGIALGGEPVGGFYWKASLTNGMKLGTKVFGEDTGTATTILADLKSPDSAPRHLMAGFGTGFKWNMGGSAKIDLLPYYYSGKLTSSDVNFLQAIPGYGTATDDKKVRYGLNARYDVGKFTLIGQLLKSEDGVLDRRGWFMQPSIQVSSLEWVYRYSNLKIDLPADFTSSLTWDREQHIFGVITKLSPGVKVKIEYAVNVEETGGRDISDNEFLTQLEMIF